MAVKWLKPRLIFWYRSHFAKATRIRRKSIWSRESNKVRRKQFWSFLILVDSTMCGQYQIIFK